MERVHDIPIPEEMFTVRPVSTARSSSLTGQDKECPHFETPGIMHLKIRYLYLSH